MRPEGIDRGRRESTAGLFGTEKFRTGEVPQPAEASTEYRCGPFLRSRLLASMRGREFGEGPSVSRAAVGGSVPGAASGCVKRDAEHVTSTLKICGGPYKLLLAATAGHTFVCHLVEVTAQVAE